jgi:ribosome-binding ATPase YchF (GTP1/OBG family)
MYVCNVSEQDLLRDNPSVAQVKAVAAQEGAKVVRVCAQVEAEVAELLPEERRSFLEGLGLRESGLDKVIREGYDLLGLITFFTAGPKEVRAWTIARGSSAYDAAGLIHSDFQKGFIRAEIVRFEDLRRFRSEQAAKEHGLLRIEGREYLLQDGDIVHFRFNV